MSIDFKLFSTFSTIPCLAHCGYRLEMVFTYNGRRLLFFMLSWQYDKIDRLFEREWISDWLINCKSWLLTLYDVNMRNSNIFSSLTMLHSRQKLTNRLISSGKKTFLYITILCKYFINWSSNACWYLLRYCPLNFTNTMRKMSLNSAGFV